MKPLLWLGVVSVMVAAVVACDAQRTVSLDEARQMTAHLRLGSDLSDDAQPPTPRRAADVMAVFAQPGPPGERIQRDIRQSAARPPAEAAPEKLAQFYYNRSLAAGRVGRNFQRAADIRKAAELLGARGGNTAADAATRAALPAAYLEQWAYAEHYVGNQRRFRDFLRELVASYERRNSTAPRMLGLYSDIAASSADLGEFDAAEAALVKGEALRQYRVDRFRDDLYKYDWEGVLAFGRAWVARRRGQLPEAEDAIRRAISLREQMQGLAQTNPDKIKTDFREALSNSYRNLTEILREQGRLTEAEAAILTALDLRLAVSGRYHNVTAELLTTWSGILFYERRRVDREKILRTVVDIYEKTGHGERSVTLADARAYDASALFSLKRYDEGIALMEKARTTYAEVAPARLDSHYGISAFAMALSVKGRTDEAIGLARKYLASTEGRFGADGASTNYARLTLGQILAESGHDAEAVEHFHRGMPLLFSRDEGTGDEETGQRIYDTERVGYTFSYFAALARLNKQGRGAAALDPAAEGFAWAERERAGGANRALLAAAIRNSAADPALADLMRQEQNANVEQSRLSRQLRLMQAVAPAERDSAAITATQQRIQQVNAARNVLSREITRRAPEYRRLETERLTLDAARQALRDGEAVISIQALSHSIYDGHRLFVWAFKRTGPVAFQMVELPIGRLKDDLARLRQALEPQLLTLEDIPTFDVALAHQLYETLLEPVADGWRGAHTLIVVSPGATDQLPFHLMVTKPYQLADHDDRLLFDRYAKVPWLAREVAIAQLPSVSALVLLRSAPRPVRPTEEFVGFGDPWFNAREAAQAKAETEERTAEAVVRGGRLRLRAVRADEQGRSLDRIDVRSRLLGLLARLPETGDEIRAAAVALGANPKTDVILGAAANERAVRAMDLSHKRVIMFATHGLIAGDLPGLTQPALALSAPEVAGVGGDGLLTVDKILDLKLNADWVVLSACNTASGDGQGAEAISGLGRAFFYAGARALLVTNWAVETTAAQRLTAETFRLEVAHPEYSRAEAFRRSMLDLIDGPGYEDKQGRRVFSYAHPLFWAPYELIGEPGRAGDVPRSSTSLADFRASSG
jgi:CHAT domain-containing protein/tetratricopeptide (TPR) repeat protein